MSKVLSFANTRQMEGIVDELTSVKEYIESKVNPQHPAGRGGRRRAQRRISVQAGIHSP